MDTFSRDTHAFSRLVHLFVYWRIKICARAEENLDSPPPFPSSTKPKRIMSSKQGGKLKPLKQPKADKKDYDESDLANLQKKKEEEKALKELRAKASQKGSFGGSGLKKSGKK
ncbi:translation machinery-associated protein 7-like [Zingiber officinale]|uniref:translation machinery-associated protein 7-like n=2 Tax=Zingiber officinale TaxID=94328 RepID=UPI001C4B7928|nr:translation machinery-associated protein 7-like [Zingiber officinale]